MYTFPTLRSSVIGWLSCYIQMPVVLHHFISYPPHTRCFHLAWTKMLISWISNSNILRWNFLLAVVCAGINSDTHRTMHCSMSSLCTFLCCTALLGKKLFSAITFCMSHLVANFFASKFLERLQLAKYPAAQFSCSTEKSSGLWCYCLIELSILRI